MEEMNEVRLKQACINLAAFMYSDWEHYGFNSKEELWEAIPGSTKLQIKDFVSLEKEAFPRRDE